METRVKIKQSNWIKMKVIIAIIVLQSISWTSSEMSVGQQDYFTVAVFEHARLGDTSIHSPSQIIEMNLHFYNQATVTAKQKGADMIVFPEYGVFPLLNRTEMKQYLESVPDPEKTAANPCMQEEEFQDRFMIRNLSCLARNNEIVIVANIGDIQPCGSEEKGCPEDRTFHYNANVVFDKQGTIVSRYWKEHLFFEHGMDLPNKEQKPVFVTDFGTFGHFVCFDSLFKHIVDIGKDEQVDAVLLSTWWGNMLPVYNSVQFWMAWALGNNATFIAANAQMPETSTTGSGVFSGKLGAIKYTFNPDGSSKLLVSRVPKSKNPALPFSNPDADITIITTDGSKDYDEDSVDFNKYLPEKCDRPTNTDTQNIPKDYRCYYEDMVNYTFMELLQPEDHVEACNNGMCCSVNYSMEVTDDKFYLGVFNGTHNSDDYYKWCTENCIVTRCKTEDTKVCKVIPSYSSTKFNWLHLYANFTTPSVYPSVIRTGMRLTSVDEWDFSLDGTDKGTYQAFINFTNKPESKPLVIAALNGRCFDRDPPYVP